MGSAGLRYGLKADRFSSHSQIARWLQDFKRRTMPGRPCVIYDIGCAQGLLGQLLDPDEFQVFGVDSDQVALRQAGPNYRQALCADIESTASFGFTEPADVLVLADVLEHTREPEECLRRLCQGCLGPGKRVIVSVPNVAHLTVRLSLLAGRFEYAERGILDRSHLRFFTQASALQMVREAGITIGRVSATPVPLPLLSPLFEEGRSLGVVHRVQAALAQAFKTVLGYQVIVYGTYRP